MEAATACVFLLLRFVSASASTSVAFSRVRLIICVASSRTHCLSLRKQKTVGYDLFIKTKNLCNKLVVQKTPFAFDLFPINSSGGGAKPWRCAASGVGAPADCTIALHLAAELGPPD
jgi:hypothetical protein